MRGLIAIIAIAGGCAVQAALPAGSEAATKPRPKPPVATTLGASSVSYTAATLNARIDARGVETSFYFQYGTTTAYGAQTAPAPAGAGSHAMKVSQTITSGLSPDITYHYRVVAVSANGSSVGRDRTFKTPKIPLSLTATATPNPVEFGKSVVVEGTLAGTEGPGKEVVLQSNPFPFTSPVGFQTIGEPVVTSSTGSFVFPAMTLQQSTQLRVVTLGTPVVVGEVIPECVMVRVSFHVRRMHRRGYFRLYGTETPAAVGAQVGFQLIHRGRASVNESGTVVRAAKHSSRFGVFSRVVHLRHYGRYAALVQAEGANAPGYSNSIVIHGPRARHHHHHHHR